jgi:sterol desaturase/sphingolipid hydroxylase (fatty acid hydroxylase superfamily)
MREQARHNFPSMDSAWFPYLVFWCIGLLAFAAEWRFPARPVPYRSVFLKDLVALGTYNVFFMLAVRFTDRIPVPNYVPTVIFEMPTLYKLILFYIVEDLGLYWVHRLMHTNYVWRIHKWHHYPTYLYWLAGIRATIPHVVLFNLAFVVALPLLKGSPGWVFQMIMVEHVFRNDWQHMNVTWRSKWWLEWIFVTPRYHQIHHSDNPNHYMYNLGSLFTIWDRIFGTYFNPKELKQELSFGIGERVRPVRLILGI